MCGGSLQILIAKKPLAGHLGVVGGVEGVFPSFRDQFRPRY